MYSPIQYRKKLKLYLFTGVIVLLSIKPSLNDKSVHHVLEALFRTSKDSNKPIFSVPFFVSMYKNWTLKTELLFRTNTL